MIPSEVSELIHQEIAGNWAQTNSHGVDLKSCLVPPRQVKCRNTFPSFNKGKPLKLWIVLEEHPGSRDGYLIVFDEQSGKFGLADWGTDEPVFLGFHGSFLNTLAGM
jgi:hypothetical protein